MFWIGVDLANDENKYPADPFAHLYLHAREQGLHVTIHAGETVLPQAPLNVKQAVLDLGTLYISIQSNLLHHSKILTWYSSPGATRIGHGIMSIKSDEVIDILLKHKTVLEVCPVSNSIVGITTLKDHPLRKLWDRGVLCSISTGIAALSITPSLISFLQMIPECLAIISPKNIWPSSKIIFLQWKNWKRVIK